MKTFPISLYFVVRAYDLPPATNLKSILEFALLLTLFQNLFPYVFQAINYPKRDVSQMGIALLVSSAFNLSSGSIAKNAM